MTPTELDAALKADGLAWGVMGEITTAAASMSVERCNVPACLGYAMLANELGLTTSEFIPSLTLLAGDPLADPPVPPDQSGLDAHRSAKKSTREALAARSISWSCDGGTMLVWVAGDRSTDTIPQWDGAAVTTQVYRSQVQIAGATIDDMADALAALVGDPSADPPVEPDSAMFDAIMGA